MRVNAATNATKSVAEAAAAQAKQQQREVLALGAELAEALDHLHLAAVYQPGAAGGHPRLADQLRHFGATLHCGKDLGVESVDLLPKIVDVGHGFRFDRHAVGLLIVWAAIHPVSGLTQERS